MRVAFLTLGLIVCSANAEARALSIPNFEKLAHKCLDTSEHSEHVFNTCLKAAHMPDAEMYDKTHDDFLAVEVAVGSSYENGWGVTRNRVKALSWWYHAGIAGSDQGKFFYNVNTQEKAMSVKTYKARVKVKTGSGYTTVETTVQADSQYNARVLLEDQYHKGNIVSGPTETR